MWQQMINVLKSILTAIQRYSATGTITITTAAPGTTAASILAANANRKEAVITNHGSETVYVGTTSGVTTGTGFPLVAGASLVDNRSTGAWYGVTASGTGDLRILEVV